MWTDTTRAQHARSELRLPSDLTDAEWTLLEPLLLPSPSAVGRPRKWPMRRIVEAILYKNHSANVFMAIGKTRVISAGFIVKGLIHLKTIA